MPHLHSVRPAKRCNVQVLDSCTNLHRELDMIHNTRTERKNERHWSHLDLLRTFSWTERSLEPEGTERRGVQHREHIEMESRKGTKKVA